MLLTLFISFWNLKRNGTQDHFIVTPDSEAENSNSSNISTSRLSYNVYYPNKKQKENENKDSIEAHYENQNKYTSEASGSSSKKVILSSKVKLN